MVDPDYGHPTDDELIEKLTYMSGWRTRDVPGVELSDRSLLLWDAIDEIRRLRALAAQQDGAWQPISTAPERRTVELWHQVWKCVVTARVERPNRVTEETKTTQWPLEAFSHWRAPTPPPT